MQAIWPRRNSGKLLTLWYIVEPTALVLVLLAGASAAGWTLPYERSAALFLAAPALAAVTFLRAVHEVAAGVAMSVSPARLATVSIFDRPIVAVSARGAFAALGTVLCLALAALIDPVAAFPASFPMIATALAATVALGFGAGLIFGAAALPRGWERLVWGGMIFAVLFGTGVSYLPSELPAWLRVVVGLNPILHASELLRTGIFGTYPTAVFSGGYLAIWCLAAPVTGIGFLWSRRGVLLK